MSFQITLQKSSSPKNALSKSLTNLLTLTGTLRDETSIINPVILIETNSSTIFQANYLTIPTFNRSYFITDIQSYRNNLYNISAHVDVLTTYAAQIKSNRAITNRQKASWNLYLNDGVLRALQPSKIQTLSFPYGFDSFHYVLAVAGS